MPASLRENRHPASPVHGITILGQVWSNCTQPKKAIAQVHAWEQASVGNCWRHKQAMCDPNTRWLVHAHWGCACATNHMFLFLLFTVSCSLMLSTPICYGPCSDFVLTLFYCVHCVFCSNTILILTVLCSIAQTEVSFNFTYYYYKAW